MTKQERENALETFVSREIYVCQSALVTEAFKKELFSSTDIENLYRPFDEQLLSPNICVRCQGEFLCLDSETGQCETCFDDNQQPQEIFEWWVVSPWFGKKLLMESEPVLDNDYGIWWGRCTTGQAVSMDYVIQKIYNDVMGYT